VKPVLNCAFAGSFFPGDPEELRAYVNGCLNNGCLPDPDAVGMVVPHAGYVYSGITAGYGFASAPDGVETVVVCAPSHRYPLTGPAVLDVSAFSTPLGDCPVSTEITDSLPEEFRRLVISEHSMEVMLPFIQVRWPEASVVPVVLGSSPHCESVASAIFSVCGDCFFIASSDLSHFHHIDRALMLDRMVMDAFLAGSPEGFSRVFARGGEACGRHPVETLLHFARKRGAGNTSFLHYSTSADAGAGTEEVVGYFSGMVTR
jgi:MEMO1 family protein